MGTDPNPLTEFDALAHNLWMGRLTDIERPQAQLLEAMAAGLDYPEVLAAIECLHRHNLPRERALETACKAWDWSIDLLRLAVPVAKDTDAALEALYAKVRSANRRFGTVAWTAWSHGRKDLALRAVRILSPDSITFEQDRYARAELAILNGDPAEQLAGLPGLRLSLLHIWRQEGAAGLIAAFDRDAENWPDDPGLFAWVCDCFLQSVDFAHARAAQSRLERIAGPQNDQARALGIRIALDCECMTSAREKLDAIGNCDTPWIWPENRLVQHLRCEIGLRDLDDSSDYSDLLDFATKARQQYPNNHVLSGLWLTCVELSQDWDAVAKQLADVNLSYNTTASQRASMLARLGFDPQAFAMLDSDLASSEARTPDDTTYLSIQKASVALKCGQLDQAALILGDPPQNWPAAGQHAYWTAEVALSARDLPKAAEALDAGLARGPTHMGLLLSAARLAFFQDQLEKAQDYHTRFRALKTAQLGHDPGDDLRDLIVADALEAKQTGRDATQSVARAAQFFARTQPRFAPSSTRTQIPKQIIHFWEGPNRPAVARGIKAWAERCPSLTQTVFSAAQALDWLRQNMPAAAQIFQRFESVAMRADLFRLVYLAQEGGVYADVDEYPRQDIGPWLDQAQGVFVIEEGFSTIANNFLAVIPNHPILLEAVELVLNQLAQVETPYAWWDSGPAQMTLAASRVLHRGGCPTGTRFLSQAQYAQCVATNLPFPHKRTPTHWRRNARRA